MNIDNIINAMILGENETLNEGDEGEFLIGNTSSNDSLDVIFVIQDTPINTELLFSLQIENDSLADYWLTNNYRLNCDDTDCLLEDLGLDFGGEDDLNFL